MRALTIVLFLSAVALATPIAFAAPLTPLLVDTCGQIVPERSAAYLAADLDCSTYDGPVAIDLGARSTFDLGGFTVTTTSPTGIACHEGKCTIRNGTVTGDGTVGIAGRKMRVEGLTISMSGLIAASLNAGSKLIDSTVAGTATIGVHESGTNGKTMIVGSTITGHRALGIWVTKLDLRDSTVTGNMTGSGCTTPDDSNCADIRTPRKPKIRNSTCGYSAPEQRPDCYGWCICTEDLF